MSSYHWPGNIRELRNVTERAALLSDGKIGLSDLPTDITSEAPALSEPLSPAVAPPSPSAPTQVSGSHLENQERALVLRTLTLTGWNQSAAARKLGVTRDVLRYRVKKFGMERPD
jgi:DNA-binding NtrC family response regulator